nr:glycosyltransferase family 52 [uncultured Psychrobacter sp.]
MKTLLIIRTPFQAWLALKVLEKEKTTNFDLLYFTQNDSKEDKYYYSQLALKARNVDYILVKPKKFDILSHVFFRIKVNKWYRDRTYDVVIFASINALVPNSLVAKQRRAKLITFDDGAANIVSKGIFYNELNSLRHRIYQLALGTVPLSVIKRRICYHYTMYRSYENIVESERLRYIDYFIESIDNKLSDSKTYFIGAPFKEVMTQKQIDRLENYVKELNVDFYVTHPRERKELNIGAKVLKKNGRIAEEAIIVDAKDHPIILVGWFSSVMLNIGPLCKSKIVLLPKDSSQTPELFKLSKKAGCTPILI